MVNKKIAMNIINQLGGFGKIKSMVAATDFIYGENFVQFKFKGNKKINIIEIKLNTSDLYDIKFFKYFPRKMELVELNEINGLYNDMLIKSFENETGLYLSL